MIIQECPIPIDLPKMVRIRQQFDAPKLPDVAAAVRKQMQASALKDHIRPGDSIAITAGSRGIANIAVIIKAVADAVREYGGAPFVLSAMGSHGGYTEAGQRLLLADYGITEKSVGCPVVCPTAVKEIGVSSINLPIYFCERALAAQGIIAVNRIKAHTDFTGPTESGLLKILTIGLGRLPGANQAHRLGRPGLADLVPEIGRHILRTTNVLLGVGIVENAYHETAIVEAIAPERISEREAELLVQSKKLMARFLFDNIDLVIVDQIGKNISGTGMDTNIVGRKPPMPGGTKEPPTVSQIVVLGLTGQTHGNACGLGHADVISKRLFDAIDFPVLHTNILTSVVLQGGKIPLICATDEAAIKTALYGAWKVDTTRTRVARITTTLAMKDIQVSQVIAEELAGSSRVEILSDPFDLEFDDEGALITPMTANAGVAV